MEFASEAVYRWHREGSIERRPHMEAIKEIQKEVRSRQILAMIVYALI